jgi:hypothetical protein
MHIHINIPILENRSKWQISLNLDGLICGWVPKSNAASAALMTALQLVTWLHGTMDLVLVFLFLFMMWCTSWLCLSLKLLLKPCHTYTTHDPRTYILAKFGNVGQCVVVRWVCVSMRYSFVESAMHSLSFAVCVEKVVHAQKCRARWTNARHAQSALDQRKTHAGHTLGIRCMFVDWGVILAIFIEQKLVFQQNVGL